MKRRISKRVISLSLSIALAMASISYWGDGSVYAEENSTTGNEGEILYEDVAGDKKLAFANCEFDVDNGWDEHYTDGNKTEVQFNINSSEIPKKGAKVFVDVLVESDAEIQYEGGIKLKGVMRLGENWNYVASQTYPYVEASNFVKLDDDFYSTTVSWDFSDKVDAWYGDYQGNTDFGDAVTEALAAFSIEAAGSNTDFSGDIYLANLRIVNGKEEIALDEKEPTVIDDFSVSANGWIPEAGYNYSHGNATSVKKEELLDVAYDESNEALQIGVDFTLDEGWSEAKISKYFESGYDITAYNQLSLKVTYPNSFSNVRMKAFGKNVENNAELINAEMDEKNKIVGDEFTTSTFVVSFSPSEELLSSITIGIIGGDSGFVGNVLYDDITLSQKAIEGVVDITSIPTEGTQADISKMPENVQLVAENPSEEVKVLAAYLSGLTESNQVLFGHQNDVHKKVRASANKGDVYDITGSVAGIMALDTLSLTGDELDNVIDQNDAVEQSVEISKAAAAEGAIISLSAHMPNFTSDKITYSDELVAYDFSKCGFEESKDLSNDCANQILPGGAYNNVYNDYLDLIADYALALQDENIPVIFRPLHENNGGWFWWGSSTSVTTYQAIYRYMVDYLEEKGVNNFLYVYSPNGPFDNEVTYLERYPGDDYIDIIAFDYYDDYSVASSSYSTSFLENLEMSCNVINTIAEKKGKIAAISETGSRVKRANGNEDGLDVVNNPMAGKDWYNEVLNVAKNTNMAYYLVWANFSNTNFYVPFKYSETTGHEMINEFIDFYNNESSIFGDGTCFYDMVDGAMSKSISNKSSNAPKGYLVTPKNYAQLEDATEFSAVVKNAENITFEIRTNGNDVNAAKILTAVKNEDSNVYKATLTQGDIQGIEKTDLASIRLVADGITLSEICFVSIGKQKEKPVNGNIDDFEFYYGNDALLNSTYNAVNGAAGCTMKISLDSENKASGTYGGKLSYTLNYKGSEVWAGFGSGKELEKGFLSDYNALSLWLKPDGNGQKFVIQFATSKGEYEVYLTDFVKDTKAGYVTIPFSKFFGKTSKAYDLDPTTISAIRFWCNSVPENYMGEKDDDGYYVVKGTFYLDNIKGLTLSEEQLAGANNEYIVTDKELESIKSNDDDNKGNSDSDAGNNGDENKNNGGNNSNNSGNEENNPNQSGDDKKAVAATKIKVSSPDGKTAVVKKKLKLSVALTPSNATSTVKYKTSNSKIATVSKKGVVTGKKAGKVTITAYVNSEIKSTIKITVKKAVKSTKVVLNKKSKTLKVGKSYQLKATMTPKKSTDTIKFSSSKKSVASVSKTGKVKALKKGETIITAKTESGKKAICKITVK